MHTALAANGQDSSASFDSAARSTSHRAASAAPLPSPPAASRRSYLSVKQQWSDSVNHASSVSSDTLLHSPSSVSTGSVSDCQPSSPSRRDVAAADLSPLRVVSPAIEQEEESAVTSLLAPAVTQLSQLTVSEPPVPASASAPSRSGRVPLSQVVRSLTERWSEEYLAEAESGDVEAQLLVAQMYMEGWGALREDPHEAKRWLLRARQGGVGSIVHQLEGRYLPVDATRHSAPPSSAAAAGDAETERTARAVEGGYFSGYGQSPVHSPSQSLPNSAPKPVSFFSSIVNAVAPKLAATPPPPAASASHSAAASASLSRSISHDQLLHRPDVGHGSGSSDEARYDALRHHRLHSHHQLYTRPHPAHAELASVHAN